MNLSSPGSERTTLSRGVWAVKSELTPRAKRSRSAPSSSWPSRRHGCEKLSAQEKYRVRRGDYRVIYAVIDGRRTVEVVKFGHRGEVDRG